ncbi:MAG: Uma2 family endonuclease [Saprospiraceae bacterium]|nr:Uma2 family endonuclease [Saprospiraceae bacterium]
MTANSKSTANLNAPKRYTLEEYFDFEYKAEYRHEFWNGEIRAMAYTSPEHGEIQTNLSDALAACLRAKECKKYITDRMILVPECNKVFYPDLAIICGEQQFYQYKKKMKATLNPTVLIKILSDSTEQQDRIDKWNCYRSIHSLQEYVIVEQNKLSIHSYRRKTEREWDYSYADKPDETINILDCVVQLNAVYAGITLPNI